MASNGRRCNVRVSRLFMRTASSIALAAVLAIAPSLARATPDEAVSEQQVQARDLYEKGARAYRERRFEAAIEQFLAADRLAPRAPLAFNVARAYEKLEQPARALQYYRDYLERGADGSNRSEVEARVRELEATLAQRGVQQVTVVSSPPGASIRIDGQELGMTPSTFEAKLGTHEVVAEREGYEPTRLEIDLDGKKSLDLTIALRTATPPRQDTAAEQKTVGRKQPLDTPMGRESTSAGLQPWPWVVVGAGAASLGAAGVFELLRRDAESDAENARYQPDYHTQRERMNTHQATARVLLGVGAALALGGGLWALIEGAPAEAEEMPVAVGCDTTVCAGTWNGSF
jgi:tetratricopeptide (TPR) repeat protein